LPNIQASLVNLMRLWKMVGRLCFHKLPGNSLEILV
jgi:hypothetical protein